MKFILATVLFLLVVWSSLPAKAASYHRKIVIDATDGISSKERRLINNIPTNVSIWRQHVTFIVHRRQFVDLSPLVFSRKHRIKSFQQDITIIVKGGGQASRILVNELDLTKSNVKKISQSVNITRRR